MAWAWPYAEFSLRLVLVSIRVGTIFAFSPYFGGPFVPGRVRLGLALAISLAMASVHPEPVPDAGEAPALALAVLGEVGTGVLLGLGLSLAFYSAELAGSVVDYQLGLGFAVVADPSQPAPTPLLGRLYYFVALAVFVALAGDRAFLTALWASFRVLPAGRAVLTDGAVHALAARAAAALVLGVQLAAPVLAALFLTDILLGMVARTMPQLNPFFVGLPVKTGAGLVVLIGALPALVAVLRLAFGGMADSLIGLLRP